LIKLQKGSDCAVVLYLILKLFHSFFTTIFAFCDAVLFFLLHNFYYNFKIKNIKSILVVRYDGVGNVVSTLPALEILRKRFPQAHIDIIVRDVTKDLVEHNPFIDHVIVFDNDWFSYRKNAFFLDKFLYFFFSLNKEFLTLFRTLKQHRYDLMVDLTQKRRNLLLAFLLGIPFRWGFAVAGGSFLLTKRFPYTSQRHALENNILLVGGSSKDFSRPQIFSTPVIKKIAASLLFSYSFPSKKKVIGFHLGFGKKPSKSWPQARFHSLLVELVHCYNPILIFFGGGGEEDLVRSALSYLHESFPKKKITVIDLVGRTTLSEMALISRKLDLFISGDSGPMHVVASMNVPVLALFGSSIVSEWKPYNSKSVVLKKTNDGDISFDLYDNHGMKLITVSDALHAAKKMIKK
jgi:ADP-heptose:LPS heptosyltransferase